MNTPIEAVLPPFEVGDDRWLIGLDHEAEWLVIMWGDGPHSSDLSKCHVLFIGLFDAGPINEARVVTCVRDAMELYAGTDRTKLSMSMYVLREALLHRPQVVVWRMPPLVVGEVLFNGAYSLLEDWRYPVPGETGTLAALRASLVDEWIAREKLPPHPKLTTEIVYRKIELGEPQ